MTIIKRGTSKGTQSTTNMIITTIVTDRITSNKMRGSMRVTMTLKCRISKLMNIILNRILKLLLLQVLGLFSWIWSPLNLSQLKNNLQASQKVNIMPKHKISSQFLRSKNLDQLRSNHHPNNKILMVIKGLKLKTSYHSSILSLRLLCPPTSHNINNIINQFRLLRHTQIKTIIMQVRRVLHSFRMQVFLLLLFPAEFNRNHSSPNKRRQDNMSRLEPAFKAFSLVTNLMFREVLRSFLVVKDDN
jgi:hypothetical protein